MKPERSTIRGQPFENLRPRLKAFEARGGTAISCGSSFKKLRPHPQVFETTASGFLGPISPVPYPLSRPLVGVLTLWRSRALVGGASVGGGPRTPWPERAPSRPERAGSAPPKIPAQACGTPRRPRPGGPSSPTTSATCHRAERTPPAPHSHPLLRVLLSAANSPFAGQGRT